MAERTFILTVKKGSHEIVMVIDDKDILMDTVSHYACNGYEWSTRAVERYPIGTKPPRPPKQELMF